MMARRLVRLFLRLMPRDVRERHGREITQIYRAQEEDARTLADRTALAARTAASVGALGAREHVQQWRQDAWFGLRSLRRHPAFALAALVTLTLGIGANTAIFSVVNAVLLQPPPYPAPDRIAQLLRITGGEWVGHTGGRYLFFRDQLDSVDALAAWRSPTGYNLAADGPAEYVRAMPVSHEYFDVFGVRPAWGAAFSDEHDRQESESVVVLSDGIWRRHLNGDPAAIGKMLSLGGRPHRVLGVMPRDFESVPRADVFVPLRPSTSGPGGGFNYRVAGRLKPGVSLDALNAEMATVFAAFGASDPKALVDAERPSRFTSLHDQLSAGVRPALLMLLGAVGVLLLIACANMANLLLARSSSRGREIALRAALGASRRRIARQLLTESVLLALAGGTLGCLAAALAIPAVLAITPAQYTPYRDVTVDGTVLAVTLVISVGTGLLFGLAPALTLSKTQLTGAFRDESPRATATLRSSWLRRGLVTAEVALCTILLLGAAMLVQSFWRLRHVDLGFDPNRLQIGRMSLQGDRYATPAAANALVEQGLDRIARLPGVQSVAVTSGVPVEFGLNMLVTLLDGRDNDALPSRLVDWRYVSANYFDTIGMKTRIGRPFAPSDTPGAPRVAVVNETFARRFYAEASPIGRHIQLSHDDGEMTIVGVVGDVRDSGLEGEVPAMVFVPVAQASKAGIVTAHSYFPMNWVVRAATPGAPLADQMREAIRAIDSQQPFSSFRTMNEIRGAAMVDETFQTTLLGTFAGIGLLLAAAGVYGLIAHGVSQRIREFGIRLALGATGRGLVRSILSETLALAGAGVLGGSGAAWALVRVLEGTFAAARPIAPSVYASIAVVLFAVAITASVLPARRAARLDPLTALRN